VLAKKYHGDITELGNESLPEVKEKRTVLDITCESVKLTEEK